MIWWVLQNTIVTALLAGLVGAACRLLRLPPAARHALWLLVLVKLVTPPMVVWPWPVPYDWQHDAVTRLFNPTSQSAPSPTAPTKAGDPRADADAEVDSLIVHSELLLVPIEVEAQQHDGRQPALAATEPASPTATSSLFTWLTTYGAALAAGIWITGAVAICLLQALQMGRIARCLAQANGPPKWLAASVARLAKRMNVRPPQIAVVAGCGSPLVCALGKSRLIWPAELLDEEAIGDWQGVIVHELAHLRRRDHWVGWLEILAASLWWWNPVFWYVRYQLRENAELACDAWVVGILPGGRRAYAEALVSVCDKVSQEAQPMPALGFGRGARRAFERRLKMVLRERVPFRLPRLALASILVLGLLSLPSWSQTTPGFSSGGDDENTAAPSFDAAAVATDKNVTSTTENKSAKSAQSGYSEAASPTAREYRGSGSVFRFFQGFDDRRSSPAVAQNQQPPAAQDPTAASGLPAEVGKTRALDHGELLKELDQKIQRLAAEINALTATKKDVEAALEARTVDTTSPWAPRRVAETYYQMIDGKRVPTVRYTQVDSDVASTLILSRTTYRLPAEKAEALKAFIDSQFAEQIDAEVAGDTIVITTTPQQQEVIGTFIALMQGRYVNQPPARNVAPPGAANYPVPAGGRTAPAAKTYRDAPDAGTTQSPYAPGTAPSRRAPQALPDARFSDEPVDASPGELSAPKPSRPVPAIPQIEDSSDAGSTATPAKSPPAELPARPDLGDGDRLVPPSIPRR